MENVTLAITDGYLHLPIDMAAPMRYLKVEADGVSIGEYRVSLSRRPAFYCAMELKQFIGRSVTLTLLGDGEALLSGIMQGGPITPEHPLYPDLYRESLRPAYHFSSRRGWLNDPNGLVFDGALYHLYYQHNPYGAVHGGVNIHWGHAVSPDAVHWTERDDAIKPPTRRTHIASGSAIVDGRGVAGFGPGALIAAYTALGSRDFEAGQRSEYPSLGQYLAYSVDGGDTYHPFPGNPAIPTENGQSWRDPRIFQTPDGLFRIAVYETDENGNCVTFYQSSDLKAWARSSRAADLYECPDLFDAAVSGTEDRLWVLYGADGMYRIGRFETGAFEQIGEKLPMDYGDSIYAGQTWTGRTDEDGRLHISWVRGMGDGSWDTGMGYQGMPFSQCMSAPCLLTLVRDDRGYRVHRNPLPALDGLRLGQPDCDELCIQGEAHIALPAPGDTEMSIESAAPVALELGRAKILYDPALRSLTFPNGRTAALQSGGPLRVRLLIDRTTAEWFFQGELSATYGMDTAGATLRIGAERATVRIRRWAMGRAIGPRNP